MLNITSFKQMDFPHDFVWGTATAAHQIEGNDDDSFNSFCEKRDHYPVLSGNACNHWELYKSDIALMKELHHQAYRMSISWARIEPEEGRFNENALFRYIDILTILKNAGIKTFVTLLHGSEPTWFGKKEGLKKNDNIVFFERYVRFIVPKISHLVDSFMVINEFNIGGCGTPAEISAFRVNSAIAHAKGYHIIKGFGNIPVSTAHALQCCVPENPFDEFDVQAAKLIDWQENEFFFHAIRTGELVFPFHDAIEVPELKGALDYWAVNYYCRKTISARKANFKGIWNPVSRLKMIDQDFYLEDFYPEGLTNGLMRLKDFPVYITENGCCCDDDRWRIVKLALDLKAIKTAIDKGVDVRGYLHWSLMDNYEWASFVPRFGLIDVDFNSFKRTPKASAFFFRDIIDNNGFDGSLVKKYLPELPEFKLYP